MAMVSFAHALGQQSVGVRHRCLKHGCINGGQISRRGRCAPKAQHLLPAAFWRSSQKLFSCHLGLMGDFLNLLGQMKDL